MASLLEKAKLEIISNTVRTRYPIRDGEVELILALIKGEVGVAGVGRVLFPDMNRRSIQTSVYARILHVLKQALSQDLIEIKIKKI